MMCLTVFRRKKMKKLKLVEQNFLTFEEGCNKYLDNCRARNLREGTINHYKQSYLVLLIVFTFIFVVDNYRQNDKSMI